jgi:hypothetical protein
MVYSLRKIQMAVATLAMAATGFLHGDYDISTSRDSCEESCAPESCCFDSCGQFFLEADLLYLRAFEGGLSNACDNTHIIDSEVNGTVISRLKGKAHDPDFKWNLGFRVGAGYEFADSSCGIGAYWTHYNSHTSGEHNWKVDFDVVDVLYGCEYYVSNCFALIPFGGLRYAQIDQRLHTHHISTITSEAGTDDIRSRGRLKEDFFGIGPLFGIEGDWDVTCGFSLYGNISIAVLYGNFHVKSNHTDEFNTGININHLRKHIQACQAVLDLGLGVRWQTCFCEDKFLVLQLGLEQHRYFNHNQFCGYGDLVLDGVSLGIGLVY